MKPFSLPEMMTRPRRVRSRAPRSTCSTMAPSSSSARRLNEFWLSPSRSNTAQAMPCRSTEKRQSRSAFISILPTSFCRSGLDRAGVVPRRHVVGLHLSRVEVVDGDDAGGEGLHLAQQPDLVVGDDAQLGGVADPVGAVHAPNVACPHRTVELLLRGLGGDGLG